MKKFLVVIVGIVIAYFVIGAILTITGLCPKSIDLMPRVRVVGSDIDNTKGPNDPRAWHVFCPFMEKVY